MTRAFLRPVVLLRAARGAAALAAGLLLAGPMSAEVAIRSGEHADFSRLVFYFEGPTDWTLGRAGGGYRLVAGGTPPDYDTSQVFDFLPRTRLLRVDETPAGLDLVVDCVCHADAFEHSPGILVIDIKDGPPPAGSPYEARVLTPAAPARIAGAPRTLLTLPITFDSPAGAAAAAGASGPVATTGHPAHSSPAATSTSAATMPAVPAAGAAGAPAATLAGADAASDTPAAALRAELGEGLGRAIAQGLATAATPTDPAAEERSDPLALPAGIDLRSGLDLAAGAVAEDPAAPHCAEPALYDVASWSGGATPLAAVEAARSGFFADLEAPDPAAVLALARAYASLGFGAEAAQVLATWPAAPEAAAAVREIARQVDDPGVAGSALLQGQVSCDTPAALWAFLATPPGGAGLPEANVAAVLRTLSGLPVDLRRQVAPAVSERLRDAGRAAEAEAARATLTRATTAPGTAMQVEILRAAEGPAPRDAVAAVAEAARGPGMPALVAQAEMLSRLAAERRPVDPDLARDVEAQIHQGKGSPESAALLDAYVTALAATARYEDALGLLARLRRSDYAAAYNLAGGTDRVMAAVAGDPSDGTFLVESRSFAAGPLADLLSGEIVAGIAGRMVALGFVEEAGTYAAAIQARTAAAGGPGSPAGAPAILPAESEAVRQVALAGIALGDGRPAEALARLSGIATPDAARMKARALSDLGAHAEAAEAFLALGETDSAAAALWRAGQWDAASDLMDDALRARIAGLMADARDRSLAAATRIDDPAAADGAAAAGVQPPPDPAGKPLPTLAEVTGWIEESAEIRAVAEEVLAATPPAR